MAPFIVISKIDKGPFGKIIVGPNSEFVPAVFLAIAFLFIQCALLATKVLLVVFIDKRILYCKKGPTRFSSSTVN